MNFTYQRPCGWCKASKYVEETRVKELRAIPKADRLEVATFETVGYQAVVGKGQFQVGEQVVFIPGETLIPEEMAKALNIETYLSKSRVKTVRLRGEYSEGLVVSPAQAQPYLSGLLKWEDLPKMASTGGGASRRWGFRFREWLQPDKPPREFCRFYEMPNLLNAPYTFAVGEVVWVSEKIHGMNARFAEMRREWKWWARPWMKVMGRGNEWVTRIGSHNVVLNPTGEKAWQVAYREHLRFKLPLNVVWFGEVYGTFQGKPIQHLTYGQEELGLKLFAGYDLESRRYFTPGHFKEHCAAYALPSVEFHEMVFASVGQMKALAAEPSEMTTAHHREGIVVVSRDRPGVMAKVVSAKYLESQGRTEGKE